MSERTAIADFRFRVCGRCGHPPSDGPCIMGNEEHVETHEHTFASYGVVRESLAALQDQLDEQRARAERFDDDRFHWSQRAREAEAQLAAERESATRRLDEQANEIIAEREAKNREYEAKNRYYTDWLAEREAREKAERERDAYEQALHAAREALDGWMLQALQEAIDFVVEKGYGVHPWHDELRNAAQRGREALQVINKALGQSDG